MGHLGVTELIWHFAGYLSLPLPDKLTAPTLYDGELGKPIPGEDEATLQALGRRLPDTLDMDSVPVPLPELVPAVDGAWPGMMTSRLGGLPRAPFFKPFKAKMPQDVRPPLKVGSGGGGRHDHSHDDVVYGEGGDQQTIDVRQLNVMQNDDVINDVGVPVPDGSDVLQAMVDAAASVIPESVRLSDSSSTAVTQFVVARDGGLAKDHLTADPYSIVGEQYRDSALVVDPDLHQPTTAALEDAFAKLEPLLNQSFTIGENGAESHVQSVSLGGNILVNDTVVYDYAGLTGTLVVLGDYFRTTSIIQSNVLIDKNWFGVAGEGTGGALECVPNSGHNVADIVVQGGNGSVTWQAGGSFHWSIDVLDGSFYDVKSFVVANLLSDDDAVSHFLATGHSELVLGANGLVNLGDFENLSAQYDLIIVQGNYHQATLIYQSNVVLNCNFAVLDNSGGGEGSEGVWSIQATGNVLINDATVVDMGSYGFLPVNEDILELLGKIAAGEQFDPATVKDAFPGLVGTVKALLVTGDYYDITYVAQTNVLSDVNVATLQAPGGDQALSTGGNQAINAVTVVDGGSLASPYLQGDFYNDTILVQADIVAESDEVTFNDPAQLASELVAITTSDDAIPDDVLALPGTDVQHQQQDVLAGVLH